MDGPVPNPNLPESVTKFIDGLIRRISWRASVREEVRRELSHHFEDALSSYEDAETRELRGKQLIEDFGDAALLTTLVRRGKNRCRPPWMQAMLSTAKVFAVLFVSAVILDFILSGRAARQLEDELEALRNSGSVTSMQELLNRAQESREEAAARGLSPGCPATTILFDLEPATIAATDSALTDYLELRAAKKTHRITPPIAVRGIDADTWESWNPDIEEEGRAALDHTQETLAKVRRLAELPLDNFGAVIQFVQSDDIHGFRMPSMFGARIAANLFALDAILVAKSGRPDAALDNATTILKFSRHIPNACPYLIGTIFTCPVREIALSGIVEPALNETDFSAEAESRFVEALANMDLAKQLSSSFEWERLACLDRLQRGFSGNWYFKSGKRNQRVEILLNLRARLFPFWNDADTMRLLNLYEPLVEFASLPYSESAKQNSTLWAEFENTPEWLAPATKWMVPNVLRSKIQVTECQVREDLARLAFALRHYKRAQGTYPAGLTKLVPDFIGELPADRFTGKPLVYRTEGNGCVIYSVGYDGRDGGGVKYGPMATDKFDVVWTLKR